MVFYYFRGISFFNYRFYWFYCFNRKKINKLPKEKIPILNEPKMETHEEWYDDNKKCQMIKAKYTFDGLNGIGYYQQQLANKENIGAFELMKIQDRLENQKEPSNLAYYIEDRYPFDLWKETYMNGFKYFLFFKADDSQLYLYVNLEKQFKENSSGNCLILKYKGPKHFLDEDKDYFLGRAHVSDSNLKLTEFYLHFNTKRKTLSLYQDKHNNDKLKEAENNKRTSSDW